MICSQTKFKEALLYRKEVFFNLDAQTNIETSALVTEEKTSLTCTISRMYVLLRVSSSRIFSCKDCCAAANLVSVVTGTGQAICPRKIYELVRVREFSTAVITSCQAKASDSLRYPVVDFIPTIFECRNSNSRKSTFKQEPIMFLSIKSEFSISVII